MYCVVSRCVVTEQESDLYKTTLMSLSSQICDRPTMKMAAARIIQTGRKNPSWGVVKQSSVSRARAKKNWRRLLKSRAFREHVKLLKDRSHNLVNHMTGSFQFNPVENPLTISFNHLNLNLRSNGNPILKDIFGCFRPFNITALMGSSGCGKVRQNSDCLMRFLCMCIMFACMDKACYCHEYILMFTYFIIRTCLYDIYIESGG